MNNKIKKSWNKIAPLWPIKNIIAVNPLKGFEDLPFKEALKEAHGYFQQNDIPQDMNAINRETIKWLQAFFDEGQSKINMPLRSQGFLKSIISLLPFDNRIHHNDSIKITWLKDLSSDSKIIINECLISLKIPEESQELFLTLMLTTLPGWASFIKYQTAWTDQTLIFQEDYLAFRLIITYLLWPEAKELLLWHNKTKTTIDTEKVIKTIEEKEIEYQNKLLQQLKKQTPQKEKLSFAAQFIFCIDVRSEPFRRIIEAQGPYQTFGCAGFFGVPVTIENKITEKTYASCPVLLQPEYKVQQKPCNPAIEKRYNQLRIFKKMYQSVKSTFTTPLTLVETLGIVSSLSIALKTFFPSFTASLKTFVKTSINNKQFIPSIESIPFEKQVQYAKQTVQMMGLTNTFSPLVVLCGHKSYTQNNIYKTSLDCGACAGHSGDANAQIFALILNNKKVQKALKEESIIIPETTFFIAAEHNTTTDELVLFDHNIPKNREKELFELQERLQKINNNEGIKKSQDWAEVRPEWGLARNASFIIGPRWLTKNIDLEGRSFLHSYEWKKDKDGSNLRKILTAPVIVAQWINTQYLFSTIDNVAFGGGSKITKNITGKIGIMQGNASDLMSGLSLQSVYKNDTDEYHDPVRLTVVIYAPEKYIDHVLSKEPQLKQLVDNQWIFIKCLDPKG